MINVDQIIAKTLKIPPQKITEDLGFGTITEWDSMNHVHLMVALEGALDTEIDEDAMIELTTVRAVRHFASKFDGAAK